MTWTRSRLVKPSRWAARGPRMRDNHLLQGCLALFPLWDGGGPDAIELMRFAGAAYHARWEVAPSWGTGRAGFCTVHDGQREKRPVERGGLPLAPSGGHPTQRRSRSGNGA